MINALITKHLGAAFDNQLSDAISTFTGFRKGAQGVYDPVADKYINNDVNYSGRGVFDAYSVEELVDTQIDVADVKLTVLQAELAVTPRNDDKITKDTSTYRVINVQQDPVGATWTIQLRGVV